jgi:membrane-associated phospholipid phosphatase
VTAERRGPSRLPALRQDAASLDKPGAVMAEPVSRVRPAVPAHLRWVVAVLAVVSVLAVMVLAVAHHRSNGPDPFDRWVGTAVRKVWPHAGGSAHIVDHLAAPIPAAIVVAALVVGCLLAKRWRLAVVAAIGLLSAAATTTVLKPLVGRTIHGDNLAFPSGHTGFATAVGLLLGLLVIGLFGLGRTVGCAVLLGGTLTVGAVMAVDQVALDAHYATDTVGGFFTAAAVVSVTALLIDALADISAGRNRAQRTAQRGRGSPINHAYHGRSNLDVASVEVRRL